MAQPIYSLSHEIQARFKEENAGHGLSDLTPEKRIQCLELIRGGRQQEAIDKIVKRFGVEVDEVRYSGGLEVEGLTRPKQNFIQLGPRAFEPHCFFVDITPVLDLRVALTCAHESTHQSQFADLGYIDLERNKNLFLRLGLQQRAVIEEAIKLETAAFEAVAYASEVENLKIFLSPRAGARYIDPTDKDIKPALEALRDQAQGKVQEYMLELPPNLRALLAGGDLDGVVDRIHRRVEEINREFIADGDTSDVDSYHDDDSHQDDDE